MTETVSIPWGIWDVTTGLWYPNTNLLMTEEKQHTANVKNGYSCECGYALNSCKCKERK